MIIPKPPQMRIGVRGCCGLGAARCPAPSFNSMRKKVKEDQKPAAGADFFFNFAFLQNQNQRHPWAPRRRSPGPSEAPTTPRAPPSGDPRAPPPGPHEAESKRGSKPAAGADSFFSNFAFLQNQDQRHPWAPRRRAPGPTEAPTTPRPPPVGPPRPPPGAPRGRGPPPTGS